MMICAKYGKNASRIAGFFQGESRKISEKLKFYHFVINFNGSKYLSCLWQIWKQSISNWKRYIADMIFKVKAEWPWRYRSRSRVITCDTPSHAIDHLYHIWKESIKNRRCCRADTIFKAKAKWPWRYRSRSKVIICNTPSHTSDHMC